MATHDYIISNASGAAVRADLNNALAAIATNNSSATEPTTTYAYQWWADTGSSPTVMKLRNAANSAWITLFQLDGEWSNIAFENGSAAAPSIYFKDSGTDTGIYSPGTDQVGISAGGTSRFEVSTTATTSTLPVVHPLGAVGTPSITFTGDLNTGIYSPAADTIAFVEGGVEAMRIDSSGRLLVGAVSASTMGPSVTATAQVEGGSTTSLSIFSNANDTGGAYVVLGKSRGATVGSNTIVNLDDELGGIYFAGADGSDRGQSGASIICLVDGTPGANDMPGRLVFSTTPDGASNPNARLIIPNGGASSFWAANSVFNASSGSGAGLLDSVFTGWYGGTGPQAPNLGTISVRIFNNGNVQNTNNSYGALSDIKLKENIIDANSQWDDIKALQVRNYNFKEGQTHTQIGLVAQEVELVSPGLVCESPDRDEDGNDLGTITKSVNYSVLYMKAVKALQEAMERIEALEAKIAALEAA
jgi:hypothetical protein